ncbi:hypothetical protein PCC7424_5885 (plasmid) [Gloeothece citriformis PCC 7424]|uniref:Uncharacterized protein n=1 Tax=Gloeothece citriformis (strain PCC 7424) TaxID=65393 RepID=B7KMB0_GLOC7|nr:hypothetical protein [Gloeothece citriformis]ACK73932.1 hypothetical protein PCC7424_5885 [Gloeothece citriformis PCC 7424]
MNLVEQITLQHLAVVAWISTLIMIGVKLLEIDMKNSLLEEGYQVWLLWGFSIILGIVMHLVPNIPLLSFLSR